MVWNSEYGRSEGFARGLAKTAEWFSILKTWATTRRIDTTYNGGDCPVSLAELTKNMDMFVTSFVRERARLNWKRLSRCP